MLFRGGGMKKTKHILSAILSSFILIFSFQNCSGSFDTKNLDELSNSTASLTDYDKGVRLYATNCASCHGQISLSSKAGRPAALIAAAIASTPQMTSLANLSESEIDLIALALKGPGSTISDGVKTLFVCDPNQVPTSTILRLSNQQFGVALSALLDDFTASGGSALSNDSEYQTLLKGLPSDIAVLNSTQQANEFLISQKQIAVFFDATYRAATLMSTASGLANYPNTGGCLANATITQACHTNFVRELAGRAFRRALTTSEVTALESSLWNTSLTKADLILETFATIASYPDFIYRAYNTGAVNAGGANQLKISGLELANKLSFYITGAPADATLRSVASSGGLDTAATFNAQVDRLMASAAGQAQLQRLFKESYGYDAGSNLQYNSTFLNGASTQGLRDAMTAEMDFFFVDEVLNKKSTFKGLMTSQNSKVTASSLAQIYGVTASSSATTLPPERSGFLTRAAFLTKKAGNYASPVKRGRHVMERVLCDTLGDPPANAPTAVPEDQVMGLLQSTRTRYENLTMKSGTTCAVCHNVVNPYGFALEGFDSLGRLRMSENIYDAASNALLGTVPVDSSASVRLSSNGDLTPVTSGASLTSALGTSDKAIMCFAKHVKEFEIRQPAAAADNCQMNEVLNVMYGTDSNQGSIYDAIKAYVSSPSFKIWKY